MLKEDFSNYNGEETTLRKAQLRMLDMLVAFDKICRQYNIEYWLDSGTLLGAVRHGGFIPWDVDVDVCVHRKDYLKLRKIMLAELPKQFIFTDWTTDKYIFSKYGRIRDTQSLYPYPLFKKQKEQGLWLDILIVEHVPSMKIKKFVDFFYGRTFRETHHYGDVIYSSKFKKYLNRIIAYVLHPFSCLLVFGARSLFFYNRDLLGFSYSTNLLSKRYISDVYPLKELNFESYKFIAPNNADYYLKLIYGDYMVLPDEKNRIAVCEVSTISIK